MSLPSTAPDYQKLFRESATCKCLLDADFNFVDVSAGYCAVTQRSRQELLGRNLFEMFPADPGSTDSDHIEILRNSFQRVFDTGLPDTLPLIRYAIARLDASGRRVFEDAYWSASHYPVADQAGKVCFVLQHTQDVTEIQALRRALNAARQDVAVLGDEQEVLERARLAQEEKQRMDAERLHLRRLFEQAPGFMCVLRGPEHVFELANEAYYVLVGRRELIGCNVRQALPDMAGQGYFELLDQVYASGEAFIGREMRVLVQRDGGTPDEVFVDLIYQPIRGRDGRVSGIFVQGHDVTAQKHARDELAAYRNHLEQLVELRTRELADSEKERRQAERALLQTQKLEAIGKLTGGVAHDFNNVLQIIASNLQLLRGEAIGSAQGRQRLQGALAGVERGAKLASQLLSFARRQPLEPVVCNVGKLLSRMDALLHRALGEAIAVELVVGAGLWHCALDPNQLENVVLNLAINARDAMQGEGKLTIEVGNAMLDETYAAQHAEVKPGQYVMIAISDTGSGMSEEVAEKAFEPFFSTKPEGQGTGLGLSMVYGFVKQSGGHIKIYSELGEGTTVRIYLPRSLGEEIEPEAPPPVVVRGGSETVLVVEDDAEVRRAAVDMLTDLGYRVLKAENGDSALAVLQSGVPIDLLFTDVVMPGQLRSPQLATHAKTLHPGLEVLFTSGYTENAIVHGGRLDPGLHLLSKPYRREQLARKVRQLLDQRGRNTGPPAAAARSLRILLVEDNEILLSSLTEIIHESGHEPHAVTSAEAAIRVLNGTHFDALLTDVSLPGMSGIELAEQVQRHFPQMRIVIASGYVFSNEVQRRFGTNVSFVVKPYDLHQVEALFNS
ncbi:response regulator [Chitiniphilus purpureus]|uniref:histidine kinase n=1 Tax=Chitiniphilus purpureus TaxID=2981137 RepID=A0ABY6DPL0_9NEIS|nr:response regulator [Chitiniphilus sp. CD1]UXY16294.1 response regulator [Chitiniphilus sp. CD1]